MLIKELSIPVIVKIFTKAFEEDKAILMSQFLEAVRKFAEVEIGDKLQEIKMGNYIFYLRKAGELSIVVVTDPLESRGFIDDITRRLSELLKAYTVEEIEIDPRIRKMISMEIASLFLIEKSGIDVIKEIAEETQALISMLKPPGIKIEVKSVKPVVFSPKLGIIISRIARMFKGVINFDRLLKSFEDGDFKKVLMEAPSLFNHSKYGDLAKALYVLAGVFLVSRPIDFPAPKIENLMNVAETIKDDLLKSLIVERLQSMWDINAVFRLRMLYIENRTKIWEIINRGDPEIRDVFLITLLGIPDMHLLTKTIEVFHKRSLLITAYALSKQLLIQTVTMAPKTLSYWMKTVSLIQRKLEKFKGKKGFEFLLLPYILAILHGFATSDVSMQDAEMLLTAIGNFWRDYGNKIVFGDNFLSSCHRAAIMFFGYYVPRTIILRMKKSISEDEIQNLLNHVTECINRAVINQKNHRISNAMLYRVNIASLLDFFAVTSYNLKKVILNLPELILQILDPNMVKMWHINRFHFLFYLAFLMRSLGYTLILLPKSTVRDLLLRKLCENLFILLERTKGVMLLYMWILDALYVFLNELKNEESKEFYEKILEEINKLPEALREIIMK